MPALVALFFSQTRHSPGVTGGDFNTSTRFKGKAAEKPIPTLTGVTGQKHQYYQVLPTSRPNLRSPAPSAGLVALGAGRVGRSSTKSLLHRHRGPAVGVPLAEHRVHRTARDFGVARLRSFRARAVWPRDSRGITWGRRGTKKGICGKAIGWRFS